MTSLTSAIFATARVTRATLLSIGIGAVSGLSVAALGLKSVVLVPLLAICAAMLMIPYSGLYSVVATTPVNVELVGPITVSRLVLLLCFCSILVQTFRHQIPPFRLMIWPEGVVPMAFFTWLAFATIAIGKGGFIDRFGPFIIHASIFFVVLNYADSIKRLRGVLVVLVAFGVLEAGLALAEAFLGFQPFGGWHAQLAGLQGEDEVRVTGTSAHPIALAGFLQLVIVAASTLAMTGTSRLSNLVFPLLVPLFLAAWWLTFSRSSWIGMGLMILAGMLLISKFTRILAVIGSLVLLALLVTHDFSLPGVAETLQNLAAVSKVETTAGLSTGSDSLRWRFENWAAAWSIFKEFPLFGVGLDLSESTSFSHLPLGAVAHEYMATAVPHNMFLVVLAEAGIVSFVLFILIWVVALRSLIAAGRVQDLRGYAIGVFTILVGLTGTYFFNPMSREIWLVLAMSMALGRIARAQNRQHDQTDTNPNSGVRR